MDIGPPRFSRQVGVDAIRMSRGDRLASRRAQWVIKTVRRTSMSECRAPKRKSVISPHLTQNRCQWPASRFRPLPRRLRVDSAKHDDRTKPESQTLWNATVSQILPWFNSVREVRFSNGYLTVHLDRPRTEGFSKWKRLQQNQKLHPLVTDLFPNV